MPAIALIRLAPRAIVQVYESTPASVAVPGVGSVSPPVIGWRGGGELHYHNDGQGNQVATEGPARFAIVEVTLATVPSGHRILGTNYTLNQDDSVTQTLITEAIPQPDPTVIDILRADVDELLARVTALEGGV